MRYRLIVIAVTALMLVLAACGAEEEAPLPTLAPVEPTPTQETIVEETATPQSTPTAFVRPTLPPTWTPTPSATPTLSSGEQQAQQEQQPTQSGLATPNPACGNFGPNREQMDTEFEVGESPRIAWTGIEGAALYRVIITNETGFEVFNQFVEGTFLDVNPDVFAEPGPYGWDVIPLDPFGIQMCLGRGDALFAE